ncbi:MAG: hypothetical protein OEU09_11120 [Rhodospirillales bacterium]|nr:hypothetical protein [Rhodospirillales bacterium]MDH3911840.1 hypothetical protein [Rhodospirillales bacterium]MDH3967762.1 hypothetical protein [Rhodospirillales bacterium]
MTTSSQIIDGQRIDREFDMATSLKQARDELGKSYFSVVRELFALSRGTGNLHPQEYFYYQLYDDQKYTWEEKTAFIGKQANLLLDANYLKNAWTHVTADKLVLSALLSGYGFPVPNTFALYHPFRESGGATSLRDAEAVAAFLRSGAVYPFFSKPVGGTNSLGVAAVEAYDRATDSLKFKDGRVVGVDDFTQAVGAYAKDGYCFQHPLMPHSRLVELCGERMSSLRLFIIQDSDGPEILRASWKIAVGDNPADNFWRPENLLAAIDVESGRVSRVVQGAGPKLVELESHPDTGARLLDVELPLWPEVRDCCLRGANTLPNCHVQGWDVAITDNGPVLIELEGDGGHPQMVQLAQGRGLYSGSFKAFYDRSRAAAESEGKGRKKKQTAAAATPDTAAA